MQDCHFLESQGNGNCPGEVWENVIKNTLFCNGAGRGQTVFAEAEKGENTSVM